MAWKKLNVVWSGKCSLAIRKAAVDKHLQEAGCTVLHSAMDGYTYYAAVTSAVSGIVYAVVGLTSTSKSHPCKIMLKLETEDDNPQSVACPARILNLLTEPLTAWAADWRRRCREKRKVRSNASLLAMRPLGTRITFRNPYNDLKSKVPEGEPITLEKRRVPNKKRAVWVQRGTKYVWDSTMVPSKFEVTFTPTN